MGFNSMVLYPHDSNVGIYEHIFASKSGTTSHGDFIGNLWGIIDLFAKYGELREYV